MTRYQQTISERAHAILDRHLAEIFAEENGKHNEQLKLPFRARVKEFKKLLVLEALKDVDGEVVLAARKLGISSRAAHYLLKRA